jgi:phosphate/sulfate permease
METMKLIVCTIILLGFVAAIMVVCNAWDTRVFIAYVATAIVADMICMLLDN